MENYPLSLVSDDLVAEIPILDPDSVQASFQHLSLNDKEPSTNPLSLATPEAPPIQLKTSLTPPQITAHLQAHGLATEKPTSAEATHPPIEIFNQSSIDEKASNSDSSLDVNELIECNVLRAIKQTQSNPYQQMEQLELMLEIQSSQQPDRIKVPKEIREIWSRDIKIAKKKRYRSKLPTLKAPEAPPAEVRRPPKPRVLYPKEVIKPSLSFLEPMLKSQHFTINPDNIEEDGRTTLMIKNIPQGYNQQLLASEIDYMHYCTYNFLYLPYDHIVNFGLFQRQCCYKYAFINFKTPSYLKYFYTKFLGRRWYKIKSDTVCDLRYARIQGKDNLTWHLQKKKQAKNGRFEEDESHCVTTH